MNTQTFETELINKAFKRCYGLKDILLSAYQSQSNQLQSLVKELSNQSGIRVDYINSNIESILLS